MDNLEIYNSLRTPPKEALRPIQAGRMKGKTDINPMWRMKALTERFGPCGIGWKYEITRQWTEPGPAGEVSAFCNINLYYKEGDVWSEAIPGTGGSSFVANEKNGPYQSDECYKMALTDALSVACKAMGVAADVYWSQDPGKYGAKPASAPEPDQSGPVCAGCGKVLRPVKGKDGRVRTPNQIAEFSLSKYGKILCFDCMGKEK